MAVTLSCLGRGRIAVVGGAVDVDDHARAPLRIGDRVGVEGAVSVSLPFAAASWRNVSLPEAPSSASLPVPPVIVSLSKAPEEVVVVGLAEESIVAADALERVVLGAAEERVAAVFADQVVRAARDP